MGNTPIIIIGGSINLFLSSRAEERFPCPLSQEKLPLTAVERRVLAWQLPRRQAHLDEAARLIGRNVTTIQADASNGDDLGRVAATVREEKGVVDIIVSNAANLSCSSA